MQISDALFFLLKPHSIQFRFLIFITSAVERSSSYQNGNPCGRNSTEHLSIIENIYRKKAYRMQL